MRTALLLSLIVMAWCYPQHHYAAHETEIVDPEEPYFWASFHFNQTVGLDFPVHHTDDGYSWYLDELYHDCDLELNDYIWRDHDKVHHFEQSFSTKSASGYSSYPDTQSVTFTPEYYMSTPHWTWWKSRDYIPDVCERASGFLPATRPDTTGHRVDTAISFYYNETFDLDDYCEYCSLDWTNGYNHKPDSTLADNLLPLDFRDTAVGGDCDVIYSFGGFAVSPVTIPSGASGTSVEDAATFAGVFTTVNFFTLYELKIEFASDCSGIIGVYQQFENDCGPQNSQTVSSDDSETYTITLASNEWIANVYATTDDGSGIIYEIGFITNWGRNTGLMGPGVPTGATTSTEFAFTGGALDTTKFLSYVNLVSTGGPAALTLEFGSCISPERR